MAEAAADCEVAEGQEEGVAEEDERGGSKEDKDRGQGGVRKLLSDFLQYPKPTSSPGKERRKTCLSYFSCGEVIVIIIFIIIVVVVFIAVGCSVQNQETAREQAP